MSHRLYEAFENRLGESIRGEDKAFVNQVLTDTENAVLAYTHREKLPARLEHIVTELAVMAYNRRGAEGESSRSEGGISRSFEFPPFIKAQLDEWRVRKVGVIYASDEN